MYTYNPRPQELNPDFSFYTTPENPKLFSLFYDQYANEDAYADRIRWLQIIAEDLGEGATRVINKTTLYHARVYEILLELLAVTRRYGIPTPGMYYFYRNTRMTHTLAGWNACIPGIRRFLPEAGNKKLSESEVQQDVIDSLVHEFFTKGTHMPEAIRQETDPRSPYASKYPGSVLYRQFSEFEEKEDAEEAEEAEEAEAEAQ